MIQSTDGGLCSRASSPHLDAPLILGEQDLATGLADAGEHLLRCLQVATVKDRKLQLDIACSRSTGLRADQA